MMNIISTLLSGFQKTLRSGKFVLLAWAVTFILGIVFAFPIKAGFKRAAGNSMIYDRIQDGILIDIFADMGRSFTTIAFMSLSGFLLIMVAGFMVNAFITRGIFGALRGSGGSANFSDFFSHSPKNYWSFLGISVLLRFTILILSLIMIVIPVSALGPGQSVSTEKTVVVVAVSALCFLFVIPVFILVSDYARAWQVAHPAASFMKSLGSGFSLAFSRFFVSYSYVLMICAMQLAFFLVVFSFMQRWKPSGPGTFLFVIAVQMVTATGLFLRYWRFAGVTALLEQMTPVKYENVMENEIQS